MAALYKTAQDVARMRLAAALNIKALTAVSNAIRPGVTTRQLDAIAHRIILEGGGSPLFLGYNGFPATLCTSVNQTVVHGIPNDTPLRSGDIVSVDIGTQLGGWCADMADTFAVGTISPTAQALMEVTRGCFWAGMKCMKDGFRIGDVGQAVQDYAQSRGYGVVRALTGHGIGRKMHEFPSLPNVGPPGKGPLIKPGMVLCLEPMIACGTGEVVTQADGWTVDTADGKLAAHYEHTVLITHGEPEILSVAGEDNA